MLLSKTLHLLILRGYGRASSIRTRLLRYHFAIPRYIASHQGRRAFRKIDKCLYSCIHLWHGINEEEYQASVPMGPEWASLL